MPPSASWIWTSIRRRLHVPVLVDSGGDIRKTVFLAGTARSGTTWLSELINYRNDFRYIFEPFNPDRIPAIGPFGGRRYLRPRQDDPELIELARYVLSGRIRHSWTERFNRKLIADRRLIKDIRANLFLKWLNVHFPEMPIVLMLRHPFAVAHSYAKQGWRGSVETLLKQPSLREDFLGPYAAQITGARDAFERALCIWCVEALVPLKQFKPGELHIIFYENLVRHTPTELERLFTFLRIPFDSSAVAAATKPSVTSRRDSAISTGGNPADSWRGKLGSERLHRARTIVQRFGLENLYTSDVIPNSVELSRLMTS